MRVATSSRRKSITLNSTPALQTKFLVAAEVFVLIPFITTHLQGNPSGITAHAGIRREYSEMKQAMFCFSCGSQTFQSTTRFISAFTIGFSDHYLYFLPLAHCHLGALKNTNSEHTPGMYSGKGKHNEYSPHFPQFQKSHWLLTQGDRCQIPIPKQNLHHVIY